MDIVRSYQRRVDGMILVWIDRPAAFVSAADKVCGFPHIRQGERVGGLKRTMKKRVEH